MGKGDRSRKMRQRDAQNSKKARLARKKKTSSRRGKK